MIWITVGQSPDRLTNLRDIAAGLNDDLAYYQELRGAAARLPQAFAEKACLIVLDDVLDLEDAVPVRNALSPRCRLLVTTRDGRI